MERVIWTPSGAVRGRAIGSLFLGGFGALWLWLGFANRPHPTAATAAVPVTGAILLCGAAFLLLRAGRRLPPPPAQPGVGRAFLLVNLAQYLAAAVALPAAILTGHANWSPAVLALIVGLHFLPLAWVFRAPIEYVTGAVMILLALVFRDDYLPVLFGCGAALWVTGVCQLGSAWLILRSTRRG